MCVCTCVFVYMWVYVYMQMCLYVEAQDNLRGSSSGVVHFSYLFFVSHYPESQVSWIGWLLNPRDLLVSTFPILLQTYSQMPIMPSFLKHEFWGSN